MIDIPRDIWLRIAQFIPEKSLKKLLTVNAAFFDMAMNARYQDVFFHDLGNEKRMRWYARLKDPAIAKRVRNVQIWLSLNPDFHSNWIKSTHDLERKLPHATRAVPKKSWRRFMSTYVRGNKSPRDEQSRNTESQLPLSSPPCSPIGQDLHSDDRPYEETLQTIAETVAGFSNVVRYTIGRWDQGFEKYLPAFFAASWSAFGSHVQVLSLEGNVDITRIPPPPDPLPALRDLRLSFPGVALVDWSPDHLAPFVNALGLHIRSLSISSMWPWDPSALLGSIGPLPALERLHVSIPFSESASNTPGLTHILHHHASTLRHLNLRLDSSREEGEGNLGRWMETNVSDEALFTNLRTLEICSSPLAGFTTLMKYVNRSADSLTSLAVTHRFCTFSEVDAIASTFSHRSRSTGLVSLALYVELFCPRLLNLLASRLPNLEELNLNAFNWGAENCEWEDKLDLFEEEMRECSYTDWKLTDIGVWLRLGYEEMVMQKMDYDNMLLIAESIPSVRKFWGECI